MDWAWTVVIPQSMLHLGGYLLLLSAAVQWITPENSRWALWMALLGGFGVGGGAGGWLGNALTGTTTAVASFTQQITAQLVGTGFAVLVFAILGIVFWQKAGKNGQGLQGGKGKGKGAKIKQITALFVFAMLGTAIAAIPALYGLADQGVSAAAGVITSALPG